MKHRSLIRTLTVSAALAAGLALAGCNSELLTQGAKANRPIPDKLLADMDAKNMDKGAPMVVRLFKQEAELEVWKQTRDGQFALLKTYPICRWSGDIGPKVREGDRQAPEGFYAITPRQMNPASAYYLSFNIGYPNAYDRAWGRSGSELMVHGDCSSRGCYAMTDEQISEIYALGREAFFGGQNAFQVQAYPFRMTPENMAKYRNNPNMPFWRMLKEGNDIFEATLTEPKVDVCEKKYVFDAVPVSGNKPLVFNPTGKCPAYQLNPDVAQAVQEKQRADNSKLAELISHGAPLARSRAGIDGGMHPVFASKLPDSQNIAMADVNDYTVPASSPAPGTIPGYVNPPRVPESAPATGFALFNNNGDAMAAADPKPEAAPAAPASSSGKSGSGFFASLARKVGLNHEPEQTATVTVPAPQPKSKPVPKSVQTAKADKTDDNRPPAPRVISLNKPADGVTSAAPAPQASIAGAQPSVPSNSFDSRWSTLQ